MHRTRQRPYLSKVTTTSIIFLAWQYKNTLFLCTITFSTSFLRFGPAILSGHTYWFSSCLSYAKCLQKYSWDIPMKLGDKWCNVSKKGPTSTSTISTFCSLLSSKIHTYQQTISAMNIDNAQFWLSKRHLAVKSWILLVDFITKFSFQRVVNIQKSFRKSSQILPKGPWAWMKPLPSSNGAIFG